MQMLYNSENFAVVEFEVPTSAPEFDAEPGSLTRGGYEIVDKFKRKEIYIEGALAESFKQGVEALIEASPTVEDIDAYIERFSSLMLQPVVLH
ncbi:BTH_I0359 family protein [Eleftheria terrae]|uniref:BTH_I0359 family protein n=1 Tax=Eleftheria terrae TaxID=1597781 RepID=UPI00263B1849|nr:DUF3567 domain-containing protein [Eleftheria terrae]WKB51462.1 DUF3567 domain-containing protein [Eleftheria terrae]